MSNTPRALFSFPVLRFCDSMTSVVARFQPWLESLGIAADEVVALQGDVSPRRYPKGLEPRLKSGNGSALREFIESLDVPGAIPSCSGAIVVPAVAAVAT